MNGTTSISALPNDETQNKVVLNVSEKDAMMQQNAGPPPMMKPPNNNLLPAAKAPNNVPMQQMSADNANTITAALQAQPQATALPNRDIQMNTQQQQDPHMMPNYIPES